MRENSGYTSYCRSDNTYDDTVSDGSAKTVSYDNMLNTK